MPQDCCRIVPSDTDGSKKCQICLPPLHTNTSLSQTIEGSNWAEIDLERTVGIAPEVMHNLQPPDPASPGYLSPTLKDLGN